VKNEFSLTEQGEFIMSVEAQLLLIKLYKKADVMVFVKEKPVFGAAWYSMLLSGQYKVKDFLTFLKDKGELPKFKELDEKDEYLILIAHYLKARTHSVFNRLIAAATGDHTDADAGDDPPDNDGNNADADIKVPKSAKKKITKKKAAKKGKISDLDRLIVSKGMEPIKNLVKDSLGHGNNMSEAAAWLADQSEVKTLSIKLNRVKYMRWLLELAIKHSFTRGGAGSSKKKAAKKKTTKKKAAKKKSTQGKVSDLDRLIKSIGKRPTKNLVKGSLDHGENFSEAAAWLADQSEVKTLSIKLDRVKYAKWLKELNIKHSFTRGGAGSSKKKTAKKKVTGSSGLSEDAIHGMIISATGRNMMHKKYIKLMSVSAGGDRQAVLEIHRICTTAVSRSAALDEFKIKHKIEFPTPQYLTDIARCLKITTAYSRKHGAGGKGDAKLPVFTTDIITKLNKAGINAAEQKAICKLTKKRCLEDPVTLLGTLDKEYPEARFDDLVSLFIREGVFSRKDGQPQPQIKVTKLMQTCGIWEK